MRYLSCGLMAELTYPATAWHNEKEQYGTSLVLEKSTIENRILFPLNLHNSVTALENSEVDPCKVWSISMAIHPLTEYWVCNIGLLENVISCLKPQSLYNKEVEKNNHG